MKNQLRSRAFLTIKRNIQKAENALQLPACRAMIENATGVCTKEEIELLKEFLLEAWDKYNPVGESFADEMDSRRHKRLLGN